MSAGRYLNPWGDPDDQPRASRGWQVVALFVLTLLALMAMGSWWWLLARSADF